MTIVTFYMYMHLYVVRAILKYHSIISQVQISLVLLVMELVEGDAWILTPFLFTSGMATRSCTS